MLLLKGAGDKDQTLVDEVEARAKALPASDASRNFTYAIQALSQNPEETSKLLDKPRPEFDLQLRRNEFYRQRTRLS